MADIYDFIPRNINLPPLDDKPDPQLKPVNSFKSVNDLLELIKFLSLAQPPGHLSYLLQLSVHEYEEIALTALQALYKLGNPKITPYILALLANHNFSSQRRFLMLKILMEFQSQLDYKFIEQILFSEKDVIIKSGLVKVYARNALNNGVETFKKCLFDSDPRVRANTIEILDELQIQGCDNEIIQLLDDTENRVKVNAAKYLIRRGYTKAYQILKNMLTSQEVWLRDSVIYALGEIGDQSALTLLKAASKDPNQGIRISVIKALAKIKSSAAIEAIKTLTQDADPVVARVAKTYLEKAQANIISSKTAQNFLQTPTTTNKAFSESTSYHESILFEEKVETLSEVSTKTSSTHSSVYTQSQLHNVSFTEKTQVSTPNRTNIPNFQKPRSAEIYAKLISNDIDLIESALKDIPFVMGDDQLVLLEIASSISYDNARLTAAKLLSRKKGPKPLEIIKKLVNDPNPIISSLAQKALTIMK